VRSRAGGGRRGLCRAQSFNTLSRTLRALGLERRAKTVERGLDAYLRRNPHLAARPEPSTQLDTRGPSRARSGLAGAVLYRGCDTGSQPLTPSVGYGGFCVGSAAGPRQRQFDLGLAAFTLRKLPDHPPHREGQGGVASPASPYSNLSIGNDNSGSRESHGVGGWAHTNYSDKWTVVGIRRRTTIQVDAMTKAFSRFVLDVGSFSWDLSPPWGPLGGLGWVLHRLRRRARFTARVLMTAWLEFAFKA
jgi:hypothetical protein